MKGLKGGKVKAPEKPKDIKSPDPKPNTKDNGGTETAGDKGGGDNSTNTSGAHNDPPGDTGGKNDHGNGNDATNDPGKEPPAGNNGPDDHTSTSSTGNGTPKGDPKKTAEDPDNRPCLTDPVDLSSGEVIFEAVDLDLPELVVERVHISSYQSGRWFGPSWSSTLDQRLEADADHIRYFGPNGVILVYPLPAPGKPVLPVEGARWPLAEHEDGSFTISQVLPGRKLKFSGPRGSLLLRAIDNADGSRTQLSYAETGAPTLITHSSGLQVGFRTDGRRVTEMRMTGTDEMPDVVVRSYHYNDEGHLAEVVNSSGRPLRFDYGPNGRMTGWQDRNGVWYRYVYDAQGRCVRTVGDRGFFDGAFEYNSRARITCFTDSLGHVSEYEYNPEGKVIRETDPLGNVTLSKWERYGKLLSRTDPLGHTTSFSYDERGALESVTRPDGSILRLTEEPDGLTIETGSLSRFYPRNETPDPFTETLGIAKPLTSAQAAWTRGDADPAPVDRDMFGRPRSVLNRSQQSVALGWTVDGSARLRVLPSGVRETRGYDAEGNEVERVNGAGLAERTEYGPFDLVTATIDPSGARTSHTYDTELRPITITNPLGQSWTYGYDAAGRLVEETDYDGRTLRFGYDGAGRLVWSTNGAGERTEYDYDVLGNLVERRNPAGTTRFGYDAVGQMTAATMADVELRVAYDGEGNVLSESIDGRTLTYVYEDDGTVRWRTPSGIDGVWSFDQNGRPTSLVIAGHTVRFEHDEGGREISRIVDGGVSFTQSFDVDDNLVGQSVQAAGAPPRHRRFSYRQDGLLTGIDDDAAGRTRLVLDATGRVTETHSAAGSETFRYDPAGNVVETREPGRLPSAGTRRYVGNRLVSAGAVSFEHDAQGRVITRNEGGRIWKYLWDSQDRLLAVATPEGERWQYRYDPIGRRIGKQRVVTSAAGAPVPAESYEFTWSGALLVEQVYVDEAQTRHVTVWAHHPEDNRPIVQVERSATLDERFFAIVTDLIGRPTDLVDAAGSPVWHGTAGLWGRESGAAATPLRFPGQYADAESGLHYNLYRYYDPSTGRYLSQDPLGLGPNPNPLAYVANPLADRDLLGLACGKKDGGGANKTNDRPGGGNNAGNIPRKILNWFRKPFKKKPKETPAAPPPHTDPNPPPPPKSDGKYSNGQKPMLDKYENETDPAKEPFPGQSVKRLDDQQREEHRVYIDSSGNMRNAKDGTLFDTSTATDIHHGTGDGRAIYTMDQHGNIYASNYQGAGDFHHSTLANGEPVAGAGELTVKNGKVTLVNNTSGHYQPGLSQLQNITDELKANGVNPRVEGFGGMHLNFPGGPIT